MSASTPEPRLFGQYFGIRAWDEAVVGGWYGSVGGLCGRAGILVINTNGGRMFGKNQRQGWRGYALQRASEKAQEKLELKWT